MMFPLGATTSHSFPILGKNLENEEWKDLRVEEIHTGFSKLHGTEKVQLWTKGVEDIFGGGLGEAGRQEGFSGSPVVKSVQCLRQKVLRQT